jgi:hypothetical protein
VHPSLEKNFEPSKYARTGHVKFSIKLYAYIFVIFLKDIKFEILTF